MAGTDDIEDGTEDRKEARKLRALLRRRHPPIRTRRRTPLAYGLGALFIGVILLVFASRLVSGDPPAQRPAQRADQSRTEFFAPARNIGTGAAFEGRSERIPHRSPLPAP